MNWLTARKAALERDRYQCRRCRRPASDVHHRTPRGMGGTKSDAVNFGLANLASLCRSCHDHVHAHPAESYDEGWLVHHWDNPELIPLPEGGCGPLF